MSAAPLDFAGLLSRNHRPARVATLNVREAYKSDQADDQKKRSDQQQQQMLSFAARYSEDGNQDDRNNRTQNEAEASKLVMTLVARTPTYIRHVQSEKDEHGGDQDDNNNATDRIILEEMVRSMMPKRSDAESRSSSLLLSLPPSLHEVELGNWENAISWEGFTGKKEKEEEKKSDDPLQLLKELRNPSLDALVLDDTNVSWDSSREDNLEKARRIPLILELGTAGQSISRHVLPVARPTPFGQSEAFMQRYEREWASPTTSTAEVGKGGSLHADKEKMQAFIEARQKKRAQMAKDKTNRVTEAMGTLQLGGGKGRTITSSLMGPGGTERTGRPSRQVGSSSAHDAEFIEQLDLVYNHAFSKAELNVVELRQHHRPKLPLSFVRRDRSWQFQIRFMPTTKKTDSTANPSSYQSMMMGSHAGSLSQAKIRTEADLNATEGMLVLWEYCEERPPIQLTKGMASKIVNYYRGDKSRCPVSAGGGDRPTRRKRPENQSLPTNTKDVAPSGKVERPPRLVGPSQTLNSSLEDWIGKPPKKKREEQADKPSFDVLPEGVTEILHPKVHGPFIGEVEDGVTQAGIINNLFVAPLFRHEPESSDFLMILGRKAINPSKRSGIMDRMSVVLKPCPSSIFTVGQVEPRDRGLVHAPQTTGERNFLANFVSFQIAKSLQYYERHEGRGLRFDEITAMFQHSGIQSNGLRQRIKLVAVYDKNTQIWESKPISELDDYAGVDALGRKINPEGVAAYESACAASRRLQDLGLHVLYHGSGNVASAGVAVVYLAGQLNAAREISRRMKKMLDIAKTSKSSNNNAAQISMYERASSKLEEKWKDIRRKHEVARFIYEELLLTPWNLTQDFIEVHKHAHGTGMLQLTGLADPSGGQGGYSFLREVDTKPNKAAQQNSDGALNAQIKKITGTDNDLRKLTMKQMASLLRSYGMAQKDIDKLKRWDRVHVIRDLSTKAASDGMGDGLERFARGEKLKLSEQKQMYRDRIQEIWRRQRSALSSDAGDLRSGGQAGGPSGSDAVEDLHTNEPAAGKSREKDDSDSDDSDDNDDLAAMLEDDFMDDRQANQLVATHRRGGADGEGGPLAPSGEDSQDLTKDARDLFSLRRQREEERTLSAQGSSSLNKKSHSSLAARGRKVIRKRITKTFPDGHQTTVFKFILEPEEVDRIIRKKDDSKGKEKKHSTKMHKPNDRVFGHSMFAEEDNFELSNKSHLVMGRSNNRMPKRTKTPKTKLSAKRAAARSADLELGKSEKRMKKRKREMEEADLYVPTSKRKGTNNRRERGVARHRMPHVILADKLEGIRLQAERRPHSGDFHRPVDPKKYPSYYEVISDPIDLQTIRDKNQKYSYKTADSFLKDFILMKNNAVKFNGEASFLGMEAKRIFEFVKSTIDANRAELTSMEEAVRDQMSGKKKKTSSPKSSKSNNNNSSSNNSASNQVMVDGVALGDLDLSQFNEDDTESDDSSTGMIQV